MEADSLTMPKTSLRADIAVFSERRRPLEVCCGGQNIFQISVSFWRRGKIGEVQWRSEAKWVSTQMSSSLDTNDWRQIRYLLHGANFAVTSSREAPRHGSSRAACRETEFPQPTAFEPKREYLGRILKFQSFTSRREMPEVPRRFQALAKHFSRSLCIAQEF